MSALCISSRLFPRVVQGIRHFFSENNKEMEGKPSLKAIISLLAALTVQCSSLCLFISLQKNETGCESWRIEKKLALILFQKRLKVF